MIEDLNKLELPEAKVLSSALSSLKESKGLINQLKPILEENGYSSKISTNFLKDTKRKIPANFIQANALFDYLFLENDKGQKFNKISEVQDRTISTLIPKLIALNTSIEKNLEKYPAGQKPVVLFHINTGKILGAKSALLPQKYKSIPFSTTHLHIAKSQIEETIASLYYASSYDLDQSGEFTANLFNKLAKKSFLSGLKKNQSLESNNKMTFKFVNSQISKNKYNSLLSLRETANKKDFLQESKVWLTRSLESKIQASLSIAQVRNPSNDLLISESLRMKFSQKSMVFTQEILEDLKSKEETVFVSPISGQTFALNQNVLFDKNKMKDLKEFLPVGYNTNKSKSIGDQKIIDLEYGKANNWRDATFAGLLPSTSASELESRTNALLLHPSTSITGAWLKLFQ